MDFCFYIGPYSDSLHTGLLGRKHEIAGIYHQYIHRILVHILPDISILWFRFH